MAQNDNNRLLSEISRQIDALEEEIEAVYVTLVLPHWGKKMHGFPQTLYGYMMRVFTFVDLLSSYWKGSDRDQSSRMLNFMNTYMRSEPEANSVALQIWRHKLMHTAQPRPLKDSLMARKYYWLLHWQEHLPEEQHFTFSETIDTRILNIGLVYLVRDLKRSLLNYEKDLALYHEMQVKFTKFQSELCSYEYRDIAT